MNRKNYKLEPFKSADDPRLSAGYCLVTRNRKRLSVIYICPNSGRFLTRAWEQINSPQKYRSVIINPLEYTKDGKHASLTYRGFDIIGIIKT